MPYGAIPYASGRSGSISSLILRQGEIEADRIRAQGEVSARMWGSIADVFQQAFGAYAQHSQGAGRRELDKLQTEEGIAGIHRDRAIREVGRLTAGDPDAYAREVRLIDPERGRAAALDAERQRTASIARLDEVLGRHKTVFGKAAQMLTEAERRPDLYPAMRPHFLEMAQAVDPSLVSQIPETYDPDRVRGMLQFVSGAAELAEVRSRGLARLREAETVTDNAVRREQLHRGALSDWLSTATNEQDWNLTINNAQAMGIPDSTLAAFGSWSPDAPVRAARLGGDQQAGGGSDYARFLQRWASDRGLSTSRLTSEQELQAREAFHKAGRVESGGDSARARREAVERLEDEALFAVQYPEDAAVSWSKLETEAKRLRINLDALLGRLASQVSRDAAARARTEDLVGPEGMQGVPTAGQLFTAARRARQRAGAARGTGAVTAAGDGQEFDYVPGRGLVPRTGGR